MRSLQVCLLSFLFAFAIPCIAAEQEFHNWRLSRTLSGEYWSAHCKLTNNESERQLVITERADSTRLTEIKIERDTSYWDQWTKNDWVENINVDADKIVFVVNDDGQSPSPSSTYSTALDLQHGHLHWTVRTNTWPWPFIQYGEGRSIYVTELESKDNVELLNKIASASTLTIKTANGHQLARFDTRDFQKALTALNDCAFRDE